MHELVSCHLYSHLRGSFRLAQTWQEAKFAVDSHEGNGVKDLHPAPASVLSHVNKKPNALLEVPCVLGTLKGFYTKSAECHFAEITIFRFDGRDFVDVPLASQYPNPQRHRFHQPQFNAPSLNCGKLTQ